MNNYKLLEKYRIKLSMYFALFVLLSFWFIQAIFLITEYIPHNYKLENTLDKKFKGVENVINNYESYLEKIKNEDNTLLKVVNKTLENVVVFENCKDLICEKKIISNIDEEINFLNNYDIYIDEGEFKYINNTFVFNDIEYRVIIKSFNEYSLNKIINDYLFFILFSLPFLFVFYFIGYYFIGKNFKPIRETISGLEDFSSNINHEMKTPLSEIISTLSLAKKIKNYDEAIDQSLESSRKLTKILDSMLGIVNIVDSRYKREKVNIIKEINFIIKENKNKITEKEIQIKTDFYNKSYFLKINKQHFDICVGNLLSNAIKYSNKKGIIEINFRDGNLVIRDYGVGINKKNIKNIFDRYFRENYINEEGYGLGLSLVKKIIDINRWTITIKSSKRKTDKSEKGTKVKVTFI